MKKIFRNIIAYLRLIAYCTTLITCFLTLFPYSWLRLPSKYFRAFWWWFFKKSIGLQIEIKGELIKTRPLLAIANHTSLLEMMMFGASINPAFVPKSELKKMPFFGTIMAKAGCMFIERNPRKAKAETAKLAKKLASEKSPLLIFPEGTTNNGNEIKPFKSAMFSIIEHQLGRTDIPEEEKLYIQPIAYYYQNAKSKKSTAEEREFYAYYVKENPEDEEDFFQYLIKVLKAGKIKATMQILDPIDLSKFNDRKELAKYCQKIVSDEYQKMIK